ncbi:MAG TPA: DUF2085 domain-containing protein [Methanomicrobia archaeon]|jgi:uncharacterized membrane protein|nr:DUF2085 domain-containing protein [Methanomicrobia archaeon]
MNERHILLGALALELAWVGGILLAPVLASHGSELAPYVYESYARVCHQRLERTMVVMGEPMAVCARCFGIYAGFLLGTVLYPLYARLEKRGPPDIRHVLVAVLPLAIDGGTQLLGLRESTNVIRLLTGGLFGIVFVQYFIPLVAARLADSE